MTFVRVEAEIIVGETAAPSIGSTIWRTSGGSSATTRSSSDGSGTSPSSASSASVSGMSRGACRNAAARSMRRAARTSALSAIPGIEPWPLRPCTFSRNGELIFSAVVQR